MVASAYRAAIKHGARHSNFGRKPVTGQYESPVYLDNMGKVLTTLSGCRPGLYEFENLGLDFRVDRGGPDSMK